MIQGKDLCFCPGETCSPQKDTPIFTIRKNDTCPVFRVQLRGKTTSQLIDLEKWDGKAKMFYNLILFREIESIEQTEIYFEDVSNVRIGDVISLFHLDMGEEKILVEEIDRDNDILTVQREYDESSGVTGNIDIIKCSHTMHENIEINVYNEMNSWDSYNVDWTNIDQNGSEYALQNQNTISATYIEIEWKKEHTSRIGIFNLEIQLYNIELLDNLGQPEKLLSLPIGKNTYYKIAVVDDNYQI